ncbi:hypothetical protein [Flavobacterium urumqiense]|uniref:Glycosyl transferase family 2 n=1 Tax=Flavobacterium urumqiense TaxID=935224 RepID=A0A1H6ARJ9_9FLAO|nr:hypothetical protein [Flavobacterium urumqiense]SEG51141.1 hypothetical protein SAMN04488130_11920 [Flavobacterium urumqiense]
MVKIKVGYLISYDFELLFTSLKELYSYVDSVYLAIDVNRTTWSGNPFVIPETFFEKINRIDVKKKIHIYEDNFYIPNLTPLECDTRERNMLLKKMGKGWLMQVDVDEYIYDFKYVSKYLNKYWYLTIFPKITPIIFRGKLVTLYKQISNGYLYIEDNESFPFITNYPKYELVRSNSKIKNHFTNINVIHQSWARTEEEIKIKTTNWGHRDDFDTQEYFNFWKNLSSSNYLNFKNLHPIVPEIWQELHFLPSDSIDDFITKYKINKKQMLLLMDSKKMVKHYLLNFFK